MFLSETPREAAELRMIADDLIGRGNPRNADVASPPIVTEVRTVDAVAPVE